MDEGLWGEPFYIVERPHERRHRDGFPPDRLSGDISSGKYYYDLPEIRAITSYIGFSIFLKM